MALARTILRKFQQRSKQVAALSVYFAALLGTAFLLLGAHTRNGTVPNVLLLGVGGSLVASAAFVWITSERDTLGNDMLLVGLQRVFLDRSQAFTNDDWTDLLRYVRRSYRVLGVANHGYARKENAAESEEAIKGALARGVEVEVLWLDPTHDLSTEREREEGKRGTREDTINSIAWFWDLKQSVRDESQRAKLTLKTYKMVPTCGITWVDNYFIVTHYLSTVPNRFAPGLVLTRDSSTLRTLLTFRVYNVGQQLAVKYMAHLETISEGAEEILTQAKVDDLLAEKPELPRDKVSEADLG